MYKLSSESFKSIERFVIAKGESPNQDRCVILPIKLKVAKRLDEVTCCMDEYESEIRICQVNGKNTKVRKGIEYVNEIINLAEKAVYNVMEEDKYGRYIEDIKMQTDCCARDCLHCRSMLVE